MQKWMESAIGSIISTTTSIAILSYIPVIRARKKNISIYVDYLRYLYDCFENFKDAIQCVYYENLSLNEKVHIAYECLVNIKNDHVLKINTDVVNNDIHFMTMAFCNDFYEYIAFLKDSRAVLFGVCNDCLMRNVMIKTYVFGLKLIYLSQIFNDYCLKRYNRNSMDIEYCRKLSVEELSVIDRLNAIVVNDADCNTNVDIATTESDKMVKLMVDELHTSYAAISSKTSVSHFLIYTKMYWINLFGKADCI